MDGMHAAPPTLSPFSWESWLKPFGAEVASSLLITAEVLLLWMPGTQSFWVLLKMINFGMHRYGAVTDLISWWIYTRRIPSTQSFWKCIWIELNVPRDGEIDTARSGLHWHNDQMPVGWSQSKWIEKLNWVFPVMGFGKLIPTKCNTLCFETPKFCGGSQFWRNSLYTFSFWIFLVQTLFWKGYV